MAGFLKKFLSIFNFSDQPLGLRFAIWERIGKDLIAIGDEQYSLPYSNLTIELLAPDKRRRKIFHEAFVADRKLERFFHDNLRSEGCTKADNLRIHIEYLENRPKTWNEFQNFDIRPADEAAFAGFEITIKIGQAEKKSNRFTKPIVNLGRSREVRDETGNLILINDVAFKDISDGICNKVSRIHAQIRFDPDLNQFLLRDCGQEWGWPTQGTFIIRDTNHINVEGTQQVALLDGDQIQLGKAIIKFKRLHDS